jgi:protein-S-isoprenylcysteine O-methyltransferase Ste14
MPKPYTIWRMGVNKAFDRFYVWAGGAAFVSSLICCLYFYLFRWDAAHEPIVALPTRSNSAALSVAGLAVNALLLLLFATHHSVFARESVNRRLARIIPEGLLRSTYVWVASLLLVTVCLLWQPAGGDVYRSTGWLAALHAGVQLFGLWLIAQSVKAIDALELAGIREPTPHNLQTAGPYRVVRHPLYSGWLLAVFGAAHMTADRLSFAVFTCVYLVIAMPWEERSLVKSYGEAYETYQRRVPWKILPYVY